MSAPGHHEDDAPPPIPEATPGPDLVAMITRLAVQRRVAVLAVTGLLALVALVVGQYLRFDALPDVTGTQVVVLTRAPGLTPEEVERLVTRPIEVSLGGLPGTVTQRSLSRYGISAITVVFERDTDLLRARQLVSERLAGASGLLPPGAEAPELGPMSGGLGEIFQFVVSSPRRSPAELLEIVQLQVAPALRSVPGVVEVNPWGGAQRTLDVVGDPVRMASRGVTLRDLRDATERAVGAAPGASLPAGASHVLLRGRALPVRPEELGAALLPLPGLDSQGDPRWARLSDVARIEEGQIPRIGAGTSNGGGEVVYVMCQMLTGANALEVMGRIHEAMPAVRASLPEDVSLEVTYDREALVTATLHTVGKSLLEGGALVALVLLVMLGSVRAGGLVASVIPLSMLGAVVWMVALGVPGNLMSLGALDFGLLVDGAVVVVETVFHQLAHRKKLGHALGPDEVRAEVAASTASVARPVFYAVLIIALVYVPVLTLDGVEGVMFRPMALTVLFALTTALALSLTFVPAALAVLLKPEHVPEREPAIVRFAEAVYDRVLPFTQPRPYLLLVLVAGGLASGGAFFLASGTEFIPTLDEGDLVVQVTRHADVSLESQVEHAERFERALLEVPEVVRVSHRIGSPSVATDIMGIEMADVFISMRPRSEWRPGLTRDVLIAELEARATEADPNAALGFTHPIQMRFNELVAGITSDVSLSIAGDDLGELQRLGLSAAQVISSIDGAVDVRVTSPPSVPLLDVVPRALDASHFGMDARDVLDLVEAQRAGLAVAVTQDGPRRIPVRVRFGGTTSAFDLERALVPTPPDPHRPSQLVPLSRIADVRRQQAPALVDHDEGHRRIVVAFNVRGRDLGSVVAEAQRRVGDEVELPTGYVPEWGGQSENLERARSRMLLVVPIVLAAVLYLLYQALGRVRSALLVFANVPFAAVGGIALLWLRGMPISISAAIGFVALSGIAVMNGVVLVSRMHAEEEEGATPAEAAVRAARSRLRPVLMTALVAGLGFVPMTLATGVGAEVQAPLATVVVGGLFTSTLLTLVVLPAIYARLAGVRRAPPAPPGGALP
jgi:cobalt-zinc-cadmium resistance protein CzcA